MTKIKEEDIIITDRHSDITFVECVVIESTIDESAEALKQSILNNQEIVERERIFKQWLKINRTTYGLSFTELIIIQEWIETGKVSDYSTYTKELDSILKTPTEQKT